MGAQAGPRRPVQTPSVDLASPAGRSRRGTRLPFPLRRGARCPSRPAALRARSRRTRGHDLANDRSVPTFLGHGTYRFQLRANPTFRRASDHRRLAITDEPALREWFARKFEAAGCGVRDLELSAPRKFQFRKGGGARPGTLCSVDATGTLSVRDETAFRAAFDAGIGPAKGFGFGLLLLQPVSM